MCPTSFAVALSLLVSHAARAYDPLELHNDIRASERASWAVMDPLSPHLADSTATGMGVYSVPIEVPPALLAPHLALVYSSATQASREVGFGWTLEGILEIERPTEPAFDPGTEDHGDGEYLISGDGFSGLLQPSGSGHRLRSAIPNLKVTASYVAGSDEWVVQSSTGETWVLASIEPDPSPERETGRWRVILKTDPFDNEIAYSYDELGRIVDITYGQNPSTSDHLTAYIDFEYDNPKTTRYDGRKGYLDVRRPEMREIRIWTDRSSMGGDLLSKYELHQGEDGSDDCDYELGACRITEIQRIGYNAMLMDATAAPATHFAYNIGMPEEFPKRERPDIGFTADLTDTYIDVPGYRMESKTDKNETCLSSGFFDLNGDGFKEHVVRNGGAWYVHDHLVDKFGASYWSDDIRGLTQGHSHTVDTWGNCLSVEKSWGYPGRAKLTKSIDKFFGGITPWDDTDIMAAQAQLVGLYDVDGDGYLDLVEASDVEHEGGDGTFFISYGGVDGFDDEIEVDAPDGNTKSITVTFMDLWYDEPSFPTLQLMMDVDGDGWLDIIRDAFLVGGEEGLIEVAYNTRDREDGWAPFVKYADFRGMGVEPLGYSISDGSAGLVSNRLVDMNADGLLDIVQVNDCSEDPIDIVYEHPFAQRCLWWVSFGLGTNGWSAPVEWEAPSNVVDFTYYSSAGALTWGTLLDINGDGLPDWVDFLANHWWPSSGSGFADLMDWQLLPDYLSDSGKLPLAPQWSVVDYGGGLKRKWQEAFQLNTLEDLNGDGILDRASWIYDGTEVIFGTYNEPHILMDVETDAGRATSLTFVPSNRTVPADDPSVRQTLHTSFPIQSEAVTTDLATDLTAQSTFTYANGHTEGGVFLGFEERDVHITEEEFAQEVLYEETYELNVGLAPLLKGRDTYTDWCHPFAPSLAGGSCAELEMRQAVSYHYWDLDGLGRGPRLVQTTRVATRGDEPGLTSNDYAIRELNYGYDDNGFYNSITFDSWEGNSPDRVEELFQFEPVTTDPDEKVIRLYEHSTRGYATLDMFEQGSISYDWDEKGALEWVTIEGGFEGTTDPLDIDYTPGPRGEMLEIDDQSTGQSWSFTYEFGDAVKATETESGKRFFKFGVDVRGRTFSKTDLDNDIEYRDLLDPIDRVVSSETWYGGVAHPTEEYEYQWSTVPNWTRTSRCITAGPKATCLDWDDEYTSFDGAGNANQHFVESPTGTGWAYSEFTTDLFGRQVTAYDGLWVSDLTRESRLFDGSRTGLVTSAWYYDPVGELREVDSDTDPSRPGTRTVRRGVGLTSVEEDEEGYQRRITFNDRGLPEQVELGKGGTFTLMGSYEYDALDRLTRAVGPSVGGTATATTWSYDLAGRLRRVSAPDIGTRDYTYMGNLLVSQEDAAGGSAEWNDFDDLGRPHELIVSDPASATGESTYGWDYDVDWMGAVSVAWDPLGETWFTHGDRGEIVNKERFDTGLKSLVSFSYKSDLLDRPTQWTTDTTGRTFELAWKQGVPTSLKVSGTPLATLTYDVRGRLTQWDATGAPLPRYQATFSAAKSMPDKVQFIGAAGATKRKRSYAWDSNDLLSSVTDGTAAPYTTTTFEYDDFERLTHATNGLAWTEDFQWDDAGNPTEVLRPDGTVWTYPHANPALTGNRLESRSDGTTTEYLSYDSAGQIISVGSTSATTHYDYDGLGRLRRTWGNGSGRPAACAGTFASNCTTLVLDWTADGQIIRRSDGSPTDSKAPQMLVIGPWTRDRSGVETEEFGVPGMSIGSYRKATRSWNFQEADGHVSATMSDAGALTSTRDLSVYGYVRASAGTSSRRFGEHGLWFDQGNKLVSAGSRHFAPLDGMFLQPDPVILKGPSGEWVLDPVSMNNYRYARNAPTSYADRDGEHPELVALAAPIYLPLANFLDVSATVLTAWDYAVTGTASEADVMIMIELTAAPAPGSAFGARAIQREMGAAHLAEVGAALMKEGDEVAALVSRAVSRSEQGHAVIGRMADLANVGGKDWTLLKHLQGDLGSAEANWARNADVMQKEMAKGRPIRDATIDAAGKLIRYPGSFVERERNVLEVAGWKFDEATSLWMPPSMAAPQ
jgi:RHS repeat-associated protein